MIPSNITVIGPVRIAWHDEGFPLLMPKWGYVASAFCLFLIGFFGFFLNLMVIILMFRDRQLWTPLNIILFNLVCSDLSVSLLGNPLTLISALYHRWVFGEMMCVLYGFFMALLGIASITTLTVISFERYLMVTRPLSSRHLSTKGACMLLIFIWTYSLALTLPPLFGWGSYVNEAANISCSVNWHEQSGNALSYILFLFTLGQVVPLTIITYSYVNIIRTMRRNSQRLGRVNKAEARATVMVFIMIIAFTVSWTPYSMFALLEQFGHEGIISPGVGVIPALVAKSSICYDPLIYVGMNTQFRQAIKRVFGMRGSSDESRAGRQYNNTVTSPARKFSLEVNKKFMSKDADGKRYTEKSTKVFEEYSDEMDNGQRITVNAEICNIRENKMSDIEHSGETVYEECSNMEKKTFNDSVEMINEPVLIIVDSERMAFSKQRKTQKKTSQIKESNKDKGAYGNQAFVRDMSDGHEEVNQACGSRTERNNTFMLDFTNIPTDDESPRLSEETQFDT